MSKKTKDSKGMGKVKTLNGAAKQGKVVAAKVGPRPPQLWSKSPRPRPGAPGTSPPAKKTRT